MWERTAGEVVNERRIDEYAVAVDAVDAALRQAPNLRVIMVAIVL